MGIKNRPYVGSWAEGTQSVVRYTPDAKILINGHTTLAVCATCDHQTDFNRFVTTITVDATTDPVSSCSLTLVVPRHKADVFSHDGNYVLHPGLEIVVLMRGYYPVTGYALKGDEEASTADDKVPVYPYYQVFRGVVTEATHEFSGGFYSCSMTCSSILHFWQYLYLSTNGSVFGEVPEGSGTVVDLSGHRFTGMSPYGIIYTLMRVGFGAAFGQNWTISQSTNIAAIDESSGSSLFKHAALWWEKRWSESSTRLRMYGMDGSLFNAMEQAYLGIFDTAQTNAASFLTSFDIATPADNDWDSDASRRATARAFGYRGTETTAAILDSEGGKMDAMKMQAYTLDLGRLGQVNFFEGEYMSKIEIANAVKEIVGYEFYQDVDGDIVFKPPFYNLDTSSDEVYCIRDRDLISISESEREPEATYVKGSGSLMQNFTGVLDGAFGTKEAKFADWRLIAQFGWRETSFESHYYSGSKQMFIGAIMRLDVANAEMRSAQITIPMRPELRPGYPVWVEHLDCFFYAKSLSHSFAPGSACQTTITGIAKRAKWLPPGLPDRSDGSGSQKLPTLDNVRLDAPGEYPPMPLYVFPEDIDGADPEASGPPRVMGYPNVVMALDPNKINPRAVPGGLYFTSGQTYFDTALTLGALRRDPENAEQYRLAVDNDPQNDIIITKTEVVTGFSDYAAAQNDLTGEEQYTELERITDGTDFGKLLVAVGNATATSIPDRDQLNHYMGLQRNLKNVFGAGDAKGEYRYYSSSAPNKEDQSPSEVLVNTESGEVSKTTPGGPVDSNFSGITLLRQEGDRIKVVSGEDVSSLQGFRVYGFNAPEDVEDDDADSESVGSIDVTTRDIKFVTFQKLTLRIGTSVSREGCNPCSALMLPQESLQQLFREILIADTDKQNADVAAKERMGGDTGQSDVGYGLIYNAIKDLADALGVTSNEYYPGDDVGGVLTDDVPGSLSDFDNSFNAFGMARWSVTKTETTRYYSYDGTEYSPNATYRGSPVFAVGATFVMLYPRTTENVTRTNRPITLPKDSSLQIGREDSDNPGLTGMADPAGVASLADQCSAALSEWGNTVQYIWQYMWDGNIGAVREPMEPTTAETDAFAAFIATLTKNHLFSVEQSGGKTTILTTEYEEKGEHTTVLPVSDNRGYEVYGTLAYGRGLTIQSYKSLLEVGGASTNTQSMLAVESFLVQNFATQGGNVPIVLGTLDEDRRAALASGLGVADSSVEGLKTAIMAIVNGEDSEAIFVRNTPVTTSSRGQSITFALSAEELAALTTADTTVCLCKGSEASHWIQAFTGKFIELSGDEAVNDFLMQEADVSGMDYTITKQALAGEMMDLSSGSKLAETFATAGNMVDSLTDAVNTAGSEIRTDFEDGLRDIQLAGQNVRDLAEGGEGRSESTGTLEEEAARDEATSEALNQSGSPPISYWDALGGDSQPTTNPEASDEEGD
jgi:hypothetical protein